MGKYTVIYNGKTYHYTGGHTGEVMEKFQNRKVFGNPIICNISLRMYDADTRGENWAQYMVDGKALMIEKQ